MIFTCFHLIACMNFLEKSSKQHCRSLEVGCRKHPGVSTIGSQLQDGDCIDGWQNLTTQPSSEPPRLREKQAPVTLIHSGKQRVGREGTKTAPHTMLLLPATLINKCYSPKHEEFHACASILKPLTNWLQSLLVVYLVKLRLTS